MTRFVDHVDGPEEATAMSDQSTGWARRALAQQVEIFGGDQISLDTLWRAVACPAGHDPRRWSDLASPLLSGYSAYLDRLEGDADSTADPSRLVWTWKDRSNDPWRSGDLMSDEFIARAYANYLDSEIVKARPAPSSMAAS
jgi:hypothetical protein